MNVLPPLFRCPNCNSNQLEFNISHIINFFHNVSGLCPECKKPINLFDTVSDQMSENFMNSRIYSFLGAKQVWFLVDLDEENGTDIDLIANGVPEESLLLHLNYTPQGNLWPMEMNSNEPLKIYQGLKRHVRCVRVGDSSTLKPQLNVVATFIEKDNSSFESLQQLIEASVFFGQGKYASSVIPANVAVELPLSQLMFKTFGPHVSDKKLEPFLNSVSTYSHQLNSLYPYVAAKEGFCLFDEKIVGHLNRLRKLRNEIAHKGTKDLKLEKKEVGQLLAAALFSNVYLNSLIK